jgi:hypothetical protein
MKMDCLDRVLQIGPIKCNTSLAAVAMLNPLAGIIYLSSKWRIYEY